MVLDMSERQKLKQEIDDFISEHGMKVTTFGRLALNDTAFYSGFVGGRSVGIDTIDALRVFMRSYRALSQKNGHDANAAA